MGAAKRAEDKPTKCIGGTIAADKIFSGLTCDGRPENALGATQRARRDAEAEADNRAAIAECKTTERSQQAIVRW